MQFFYLEAFCFLVNLVSLFKGWSLFQWSWAALLVLQLVIEVCCPPLSKHVQGCPCPGRWCDIAVPP